MLTMIALVLAYLAQTRLEVEIELEDMRHQLEIRDNTMEQLKAEYAAKEEARQREAAKEFDALQVKIAIKENTIDNLRNQASAMRTSTKEMAEALEEARRKERAHEAKIERLEAGRVSLETTLHRMSLTSSQSLTKCEEEKTKVKEELRAEVEARRREQREPCLAHDLADMSLDEMLCIDGGCPLANAFGALLEHIDAQAQQQIEIVSRDWRASHGVRRGKGEFFMDAERVERDRLVGLRKVVLKMQKLLKAQQYLW